MWSTCVLGWRLQTVQMGCSRKTTPLFFRYSGCLWAWLMLTHPLFVWDARACLFLKPNALTPRALASSHSHNFIRLPHSVLLQRDLPSLPNVTNRHATGLGHARN